MAFDREKMRTPAEPLVPLAVINRKLGDMQQIKGDWGTIFYITHREHDVVIKVNNPQAPTREYFVSHEDAKKLGHALLDLPGLAPHASVEIYTHICECVHPPEAHEQHPTNGAIHTCRHCQSRFVSPPIAEPGSARSVSVDGVPVGWFPFGHHAGGPVPALVFSEVLDDDGSPRWERLAEQGDGELPSHRRNFAASAEVPPILP